MMNEYCVTNGDVLLSPRTPCSFFASCSFKTNIGKAMRCGARMPTLEVWRMGYLLCTYHALNYQTAIKKDEKTGRTEKVCVADIEHELG